MNAGGSFTFGSGVDFHFKADTSKSNDNYWWATQVAGEKGLFILKDLDEPALLHEGIAYDVVRGSTAHLLVDVDNWKDFISTRTHLPGS